jgi:hypothetical protein
LQLPERSGNQSQGAGRRPSPGLWPPGPREPRAPAGGPRRNVASGTVGLEAAPAPPAARQRPEPAPPRPPHSRPESWPRETQSSPQRIDAPPPAPLGLQLPLRRRPRVARMSSGPPAPSPPPVSEPAWPCRQRSHASSSSPAARASRRPSDPNHPINNQFPSSTTAHRPGTTGWPLLRGAVGRGMGTGARVSSPAPVPPWDPPAPWVGVEGKAALAPKGARGQMKGPLSS